VQVSTSTPKFDSGECADPFCSRAKKAVRTPFRPVVVIRSDHVLPCCFQKCVPGPRRCVRCTDMGIEDCAYGQAMKKGRMNEACARCRLARTHMEIL
jgi:hypothetical protein